MAIDNIVNEWPKILLDIKDRMRVNSSTWISPCNNPKLITADFSDQFSKTIIQELEASMERISESFIQPDLNTLSMELEQDIEKIKTELKNIDIEFNSTLSVRFKLSSERLSTQISLTHVDGDQIFRSARKTKTWIAVGVSTALFAVGAAPMAMMAIMNGIMGFFDYKLDPVVLRKKIVEERLNDFDKSKDKIREKIIDEVYSNFEALEVGAEDIYRSAMMLLNLLLKDREKDIQKSEESRLAEDSYLENKISIANAISHIFKSL